MVTVPENGLATPIEFRLTRWIDAASQGWYSGDHHVHAAGCSHYESPTEGVRPEDMMRHVLGEALSIGAVLNWGPSYYHQRQYFEARDNHLSTASTLLRYDLEVSGFPSSHCGHLVLLRLRDQDYPETRQIEDWPSWDLPILKWAKAQGAVAGFAHSGRGLQVKSRDLPNYEIPPFDGIGANEFIVDVTHDAVDFISACDTQFVHELNIWYHTLNCGYRTRISGETDFPCMSDQRVGAGRSYVQIAGALSYDAWCEGIRSGRSYVSDGHSHVMNLTANGVPLGVGASELALAAPSRVTLSARVACLLPERAPEAGRPDQGRGPYWTPEHARIGSTRQVEVEAVVNGRAVGITAHHRRRHVSRDPDRGRDRAKQLDRAADPRVRPHQPDLRHRRRPADSRIEAKRRVVPRVRSISAGRRRWPGSGLGSATRRCARSNPRELSTTGCWGSPKSTESPARWLGWH